MKIVQSSPKKDSVKIGDVIHVRGTSKTNRGDDMFLQVIEVNGIIRLLNIEKGWCVGDTFNLGYRNAGLLLDKIHEEWKAWKVIGAYDSGECSISIPFN